MKLWLLMLVLLTCQPLWASPTSPTSPTNLKPTTKATKTTKEKKPMLTGTLKYVDIETGSWVLATPQGNYQLFFIKQRPTDLKSLIGKTVQVAGKVRSELATTNMTGTVLEVETLTLVKAK